MTVRHPDKSFLVGGLGHFDPFSYFVICCHELALAFSAFYLCVQFKMSTSCVVKILFVRLAVHVCPAGLCSLFKSICVKPLFEKVDLVKETRQPPGQAVLCSTYQNSSHITTEHAYYYSSYSSGKGRYLFLA